MLNSEKTMFALNDIRDDYIESSRTMLGYKIEEKRFFSIKRRVFATALAAVLILSLSIVAYAVYVHWSRGMEQRLPATAEEQQMAVESGLSDTSQHISATANGVTISVEQTIIDDDTAKIALRIEGWNLDKEQELNAMLWGGFPTFDGETAPAMGGSFVEERDANDRVYIVAADGSIEYDVWARAEDKLGTLSGREIHITIESLGICGKGEDYQPLVEGPWELTWTPSSNSDSFKVQPDAAIGNTEIKLVSAEIGPVSAKVLLQLPSLWEGYKALEHYSIQLVGVRLKDGTVLTNIFGPPSQEGYADIDNLILELCYSSGKILQPEQVDSLIFAGDFPWARFLSDSELIYVPIV